MDKLRAILVDDELAAREVLTGLLSRFCKNVEIVGEAENLTKGVELIKKEKPDVVFLDIQMPVYAGYEIVNFIDPIDFQIIFITAFDQYAIKAFEISAVDYILKPIEIDRLQKAVEKVEERKSLKDIEQSYAEINATIQTQKASKITLFEKGQRELISIETIVALEGYSAYCKVHLTDGTTRMISKNLKTTLSYLDGWNNFYRSHKSWVINKDFVQSYSKSKQEITLQNDLIAKVSRTKLSELEAELV